MSDPARQQLPAPSRARPDVGGIGINSEEGDGQHDGPPDPSNSVPTSTHERLDVLDPASQASMNAAGSPSATSRTSTSSSSQEAPLSFSSAEDSPPLPQPRERTSPVSGHPRSAQHPARPTLNRAGTDPYVQPGQRARSHSPVLGFPPSHRSLNTSHNEQPEAGPSSLRPRPTRYADPDTHWLSEDEGEMHVRDIRLGRRRARGQHGGHDSGSGSEGKDGDSDKQTSVLLPGATERSHSINHKPATYDAAAFLSKDYANLIPDAGFLYPALRRALQCPTCHELMKDPMILLCGHSLCLRCSVSPSRPISTTMYAANVAVAGSPPPPPPLGFQRSASPGTPEPEDRLVRRPIAGVEMGETASGASNRAKVLLADTQCAVAACRKITKARGQGRQGISTDFVLQKITSLVRENMPMDGDDDLDEQDPAPASVECLASPSNCSSPEDPLEEHVAPKRSMGSKTQRLASKRSKHKAMPEPSGSPTVQPFVSDILLELECQVCVTLMWEPMSTPCGHTFCKRCLFRSLDHSNRCPLCRTELPGYNFFLAAPLNHTISNLIVTAFPALYTERKEMIEKEDSESSLDTPIFVCMVSFPAMPTNLHIYEPKYRLMIRRAMDTNRRFGMVLPSRQSGGFSQYGTMLEIRNMHLLEDGRSVVETVGIYRFKILESGVTDGYVVGRIERIEDITEEEEDALERRALEQAPESRAPVATNGSEGAPAPAFNPVSVAMRAQGSTASEASNTNTASDEHHTIDTAGMTNAELVKLCRDFVDALRNGSTPWLLQRLNSALPPMPDDAREFTWWMAMLMPIDDHEKARLLQITSYRLRLRLIVYWIQQMQESWWFSRGCTIA